MDGSTGLEATRSNEPDLDQASGAWTVADLVNYRDACQRDLLERLNDLNIKGAQNAIVKANKLIVERVSQTLEAAYKAADKQNGDMTVKTIAGVVVKGSISKTVKWDQPRLLAIAGAMPWEKAQHYFKIELTVPEAIYKAIEPGDFKMSIMHARTTTYGKPSVNVTAIPTD